MNTQKYLKKILTEKLVGNDLNLIKNITNYLPQYKYEKNVVCRIFQDYQLEKYGWINDNDSLNHQQLTEFYFPDIDITLFTIAHTNNHIDIEDVLEGSFMDIHCYDDWDIENAGDLQEYYLDNYELFYKYKYISKIYEHHKKILKHRKYLEELYSRITDLNNDEESSDNESIDISDISSSDEEDTFDENFDETKTKIRSMFNHFSKCA